MSLKILALRFPLDIAHDLSKRQNGILHFFQKVLISSFNPSKLMLLDQARTYLQLPLRQWGAGNVDLLVLSSWKVNIAENPIALMGL